MTANEMLSDRSDLEYCFAAFWHHGWSRVTRSSCLGFLGFALAHVRSPLATSYHSRLDYESFAYHSLQADDVLLWVANAGNQVDHYKYWNCLVRFCYTHANTISWTMFSQVRDLVQNECLVFIIGISQR